MKVILIVFFALSLAFLGAQTPNYYPTNTLIENFGASWCVACAVAQEGLNVIEAEVNPGEISIPRLLTESGEYSTPEIDARFDYYDVLSFPAVIFNGKTRVNGSDEQIEDGSLYRAALNQFRFLASPLKMSVVEASHSTGNYSFNVEMLHEEISLDNANVVFYLVEDAISADLNRIVRAVQSQTITLAGQGNSQQFDFAVSPSPAWNLANLWAVAFVQLEGRTILQSVSTLTQPQQQTRVAAPFDLTLNTPEPGSYFSPHFFVYSLGAASQITTYIQSVDVPEDWYLNYCDIDGFCYPGNTPYNHDIAADSAKEFDLNIFTGSLGTGTFNFVIESNLAPTYVIPFKMVVGPVSSTDAVQSPALISVKSTWPNPFRDRLSFDLQSAKAGQSANITIYNSRGQKVDSISLQNLEKGSNQIDWQARELPSGLYFYRLNGSNEQGKLLKLN